MEQADSHSQDILPQKKKRKVSDVWNHYTKLAQGTTAKAICKNCQSALSAQTSSGTNHLWRHLKRCQQANPSTSRLQLPQQQQASNHQQQPQHLTQQQQPKQEQLQQPKQSRSKANNHIQHNLLQTLVLHQTPLQVVQAQPFQSFLNSLNPFHPVLTPANLKQASLNQFKSQSQSILNHLRQHRTQLAISIEPWVSQRSTHFIKLSVHYIDHHKSRLIKTTLAFKPISDPTNEIELSNQIFEILLEWKIAQNCASITTEDSTANDLAIKRLQSLIQGLSTDQHISLSTQNFYFHINCASSLTNQIVTQLLQKHQPVISHLRKIITFLTLTEFKKKNFRELIETYAVLKPTGITGNGDGENDFKNWIPSVDFPNCWDSTYLMIATSIQCKSVFNHLQSRDPDFPYDSLSTNDWNQLQNLNQTLEVLHHAICSLSNTDSSPTASTIYVNMRKLQIWSKNEGLREAQDQAGCQSADIKPSFFPILDHLNAFWTKNSMQEFSELGSVFDPRIKFDYLTYSLHNQFGIQAHSRVADLRSRLYAIYRDYYQASIVHQSSITSESTSKHHNMDSIPVDPRMTTMTTETRTAEDPAGQKALEMDEFERFLARSSLDPSQLEYAGPSSSCSAGSAWIAELDLYLLEPAARHLNHPPLANAFDILAWWTSQAQRFPNLSKFALGFLTIPVSAIDPESRFYLNGGKGRELNEYHSSLDDYEFLESLVCNRDWIRDPPSSSSPTTPVISS